MANGQSFRVTATGINLRAAPDTDSAVLGVIRRGEIVTASDTAPIGDGWLAVSWHGLSGFAKMSFLELAHDAPAAPAPVASPAPAAAPAAAIDPNRRDTDPNHLHPAFRSAAANILKALADASAPFRLFEGFRPPERQTMLYRQGRDVKFDAAGRPLGVVTKAKAWQSYHQYGLAGDFVLFIDGRWSWDTAGSAAAWWDKLQALASAHGLEPLSFERPHLQLRGLTLGALLAGNFPSGGDPSWRDNLDATVLRAHAIGDPSAPPVPATRPPL